MLCPLTFDKAIVIICAVSRTKANANQNKKGSVMNGKITIELKDARIIFAILNEIETSPKTVFGRCLQNAKDIIGSKIAKESRNIIDAD